MVTATNVAIGRGRKTAPSRSSAIVEPDEPRAARLRQLKALVESGNYEISSPDTAEQIVDHWFWNPPTVPLESEVGVVELVGVGFATETVFKQLSFPVESEFAARRQSPRSLRPPRGRFDVGEWINLRRLHAQLSRMARYAHL